MKSKIEIFGTTIDKLGRVHKMSYGTRDTQDEADAFIVELRVRHPTTSFVSKRIESWD